MSQRETTNLIGGGQWNDYAELEKSRNNPLKAANKYLTQFVWQDDVSLVLKSKLLHSREWKRRAVKISTLTFCSFRVCWSAGGSAPEQRKFTNEPVKSPHTSSILKLLYVNNRPVCRNVRNLRGGLFVSHSSAELHPSWLGGVLVGAVGRRREKRDEFALFSRRKIQTLFRLSNVSSSTLWR